MINLSVPSVGMEWNPNSLFACSTLNSEDMSIWYDFVGVALVITTQYEYGNMVCFAKKLYHYIYIHHGVIIH